MDKPEKEEVLPLKATFFLGAVILARHCPKAEEEEEEINQLCYF